MAEVAKSIDLSEAHLTEGEQPEAFHYSADCQRDPSSGGCRAHCIERETAAAPWK